jgi:hypothetical protein
VTRRTNSTTEQQRQRDAFEIATTLRETLTTSARVTMRRTSKRGEMTVNPASMAGLIAMANPGVTSRDLRVFAGETPERGSFWHLVGAYLDAMADEEATTVLRSIAQQ